MILFNRITANIILLFLFLIVAFFLVSCGSDENASENDERKILVPFKDQSNIPIGVAVGLDDLLGSITHDLEMQELIKMHFSSLTPENHMKMALIHPEPEYFEWAHIDWLYQFAEDNLLEMHAHTLVWHRSVPYWVSEYQGNQQEWEELLRNHITTVVSRYSGRTLSWDVVNEAIDDDEGTLRESVFQQNIPDYIHQSFRWAHSEDSAADLYYNDYHFANYPIKWVGILELIDSLLEQEVPIHGVGFQLHMNERWPDPDQIREAFGEIVNRGLKVRISELDVSLNAPWIYDNPRSEFTEKMSIEQGRIYKEVIEAYFDVVPLPLQGGITVWGLSDNYSWLPPWYRDTLNNPRDDWPLLFDNNLEPKRAAFSFSETLGQYK